MVSIVVTKPVETNTHGDQKKDQTHDANPSMVAPKANESESRNT